MINMKLFKHKNKGIAEDDTLKNNENLKSVSISEFNQVRTLIPLNLNENLETTKNLSLSADYICNYNTGDNLDGSEKPYRHIKDELNERFKKLKSGSMQEGVNSTSDEDYGICLASPSPHIASAYASHTKILSEAINRDNYNKKGPSFNNITSMSHAVNRSSNIQNMSIMSRNSSENSSLESSSIGTWDSNLNSEFGNQHLYSCEDSEGSSFDLMASNIHHGPSNVNLKNDAAYHKISLKQKNRRSPQNKKPHHLAPITHVNEFELPSMPEVSADFEHLEEQMIVTKQKETLSKLEKEGKFSCSKLVQSKDDMKNVMELLKTTTSGADEQESDYYFGTKSGGHPHHSPYHTLEYPETATHQNQVSKMIEEMKMRSSKKRLEEKRESRDVEGARPIKPPGASTGFCLSSFFKFGRKADKNKDHNGTTHGEKGAGGTESGSSSPLGTGDTSPTKRKQGKKEKGKQRREEKGPNGEGEKKKEKRGLDFFCTKSSDAGVDGPTGRIGPKYSNGERAVERPAYLRANDGTESGSPPLYNPTIRAVSLSMSSMHKCEANPAASPTTGDNHHPCLTSASDRKQRVVDGLGKASPSPFKPKGSLPPAPKGKSFASAPSNTIISTVSLNLENGIRGRNFKKQSTSAINNDQLVKPSTLSGNGGGFFARLRCSLRKKKEEKAGSPPHQASQIIVSSPAVAGGKGDVVEAPGGNASHPGPVMPKVGVTDGPKVWSRGASFKTTNSKSTYDVRLIIEPVHSLVRRHSHCETPNLERGRAFDGPEIDDLALPSPALRSPLNFKFIFGCGGEVEEIDSEQGIAESLNRGNDFDLGHTPFFPTTKPTEVIEAGERGDVINGYHVVLSPNTDAEPDVYYKSETNEGASPHVGDDLELLPATSTEVRRLTGSQVEDNFTFETRGGHAFEPNYHFGDGNYRGILPVPLQFQQEPNALWILSHLNQSSLFYVNNPPKSPANNSIAITSRPNSFEYPPSPRHHQQQQQCVVNDIESPRYLGSQHRPRPYYPLEPGPEQSAVLSADSGGVKKPLSPINTPCISPKKYVDILIEDKAALDGESVPNGDPQTHIEDRNLSLTDDFSPYLMAKYEPTVTKTINGDTSDQDLGVGPFWGNNLDDRPYLPTPFQMPRPNSTDGALGGLESQKPRVPSLIEYPLAPEHPDAGQALMSASVHGLPPLPNAAFTAQKKVIVPGLRMGCLSPAGTSKVINNVTQFSNASRCGLRNYTDLICHTRRVSPMLTQRRSNFVDCNSESFEHKRDDGSSPEPPGAVPITLNKEPLCSSQDGEAQTRSEPEAAKPVDDKLVARFLPPEFRPSALNGHITEPVSNHYREPKLDACGHRQTWISREKLQFLSENLAEPEPSMNVGDKGPALFKPKTFPYEQNQRNGLFKDARPLTLQLQPSPIAATYNARPKSYEFNLLLSSAQTTPAEYERLDENRFRSNSVQGKFPLLKKSEDSRHGVSLEFLKDPRGAADVRVDTHPPIPPRKKVKDMINTFQKLSSQN